MRRIPYTNILLFHPNVRDCGAYRRKVWQKEAEKKEAIEPTSIKSGVYNGSSFVYVNVCAWMWMYMSVWENNIKN